MRDTYSLYDAKAKLSAIVRKVREWRERGIVRNQNRGSVRRPIAKRPGALKRFLDERDE